MAPKWLNQSNTAQYDHLDQGLSPQSEPKENSSDFELAEAQGGRKKRYTTIAIYTLLFTSLCFAAIAALSFTSENFGPGRQFSSPTPCGSSPAEARTAGCIFDVMSFSWLSPSCFDADLTHEFEHHADWHWYRNPMATKEVAKEEVLQGESRQLFVDTKYHRAHCTFMWKKLHRALAKGWYVDSYIGSYNHTKHCEHMLLGEDSHAGGLSTAILTKFPRCVSKQAYM
jgi:hypothetical protein